MSSNPDSYEIIFQGIEESAPYEERVKIEEMAQQFTRFILNIMDDSRQRYFLYRMLCQHRTLQQEFTGLCLKWLYGISGLAKRDKVRFFDLRNEASAEAAHKVVDALGPCGYRLPTV